MTEPALSVIVPIYNMERYLRHSIESVLGQTLSDLELILIDDASQDGSLELCKQYAARDTRVVLIEKQQNEGVDRGRFTGIAAARGRYLCFVDPDDWLSHSDVLRRMLLKADETGADIVQVQRVKVVNDREWPRLVQPDFGVGLVEGERLRECWKALLGDNFLAGGMWAKLYRKTTIDRAGLKPSGLKRSQDVVFNLQLGPYVKSIYFINEPGYTYRWGYKPESYRAWLLPAAKEKFRLRLQVIEKQGVKDAHDLPRQGLLGKGLREEINQRLRFGLEVKEWLKEELNDEIWQQATDLHDANLRQDPFVKAVARGDGGQCYRVVLQRDRAERLKRRLKAAAYAVLRKL